MASWNVQGIAQKVTEVMDALNNQEIDVGILTETKRKGRGHEELEHYFYAWSGVDKSQRAAAGVAILVHKKHTKYINNLEYISERIISMTLPAYGYITTIIGVYAPTDDSTTQIKDSFYKQLTEVMDSVPQNHEIVLTGDLNARVGSRLNDEVVGQYGEDKVNSSGELLIEHCKQHRLRIVNGYFAHKNIHKYTWERPTLRQKSIIDYFITKQQSQLRYNDCHVKRGRNCGSDHYMVVLMVMCPYTTNKKIKEIKPMSSETIEDRRYKLHLLQQDSIKQLYQNRLREELQKRSIQEDVEEEYENVKEALHKAAMEALGMIEKTKIRTKPAWLTEEIQELIQQKNHLYNKWLTKRTAERREDYTTKNKEVEMLRTSILGEQEQYVPVPKK